MPKTVDRSARRAEIVQAAWRVIRDAGLEGATIRAIAAEAGASTAVVTHYFHDKRDILKEVLLASQTVIAQRRRSAVAGLSGIAALEAALVDSLPLDEERRMELHIEVSFWARAISDAESAAEHLKSHDQWRRALANLLRDCVRLGEIGDCDVNQEADTLVALLDGIGVDALMHPNRLPPARQMRLVKAALARLQPSATPG